MNRMMGDTIPYMPDSSYFQLHQISQNIYNGQQLNASSSSPGGTPSRATSVDHNIQWDTGVFTDAGRMWAVQTHRGRPGGRVHIGSGLLPSCRLSSLRSASLALGDGLRVRQVLESVD